MRCSGRVFIWERASGRLVKTLDADDDIVNCVVPHPTSCTLASSGIGSSIKLWAPIAPDTPIAYQQALRQ